MKKLTIGIVGLGLIGGSFAKALRAYTPHKIFGSDIDKDALQAAKADGVLDSTFDTAAVQCDILILAINPEDCEKYLSANASAIKKETVVFDCGGVKRSICRHGAELAREYGFVFIGAHPMAGHELSGYSASSCDLFKGASMILTPEKDTPSRVLSDLEALFTSIGFACVVSSDPQTHDKIIAFTSQLAHIASGAFIQSKTALCHSGFSAGSFRDLTRVAYLDEKMWSELFLLNADNLLVELDGLILRLQAYRTALSKSDRAALMEILLEGKNMKIATQNKTSEVIYEP